MKRQVLLSLAMVATLVEGALGAMPSETAVADAMNNAMRDSDLPAVVAIAVNREGEQVSYTYGKAIWSESSAVTPDHIFRIASMTKLVTSIAALQLVEQGIVGLDDDLSELMPDMAEIPLLRDGKLVTAQSRITLRHLLTHSSGFGYEGATVQGEWDGHDEWSYEDAPRRFEAGTDFLYGTSTDWVGKLVERLSGLSLDIYVEENITGPLGMKRTFFEVPEELHPLLVSFGSRGEDGAGELTESPGRVPASPPERFGGGGGLFSTPADYMKLLLALLNDGQFEGGRILTRETISALQENQIPTISMDPSERYYLPSTCCNFNGLMDSGSGWGLAAMLDFDARPYGRSAGTMLWGGIFNTYFFVDFESGVAASIFTQHLPFNHPATTTLFERFSELVYSAQ